MVILLKPPLLFLLIGAAIIIGGILLIFNIHEEKPSINRTIIMHIEKRPKTATLSVEVTERIVSSKPLDKINWWEIVPALGTRWSGGDRPSSFFTVTDENLNDIIDYSRPPMNATHLSTRMMGFHGVDVICMGVKEEAYFVAVPSLAIPDIPLKNATVALVKYDLPSIRPEKGIYHIKFASFYEAKIELPSGATITSDDTRICSLGEHIFEQYKPRIPDSRMVIIYDIKFRLE